MIEYVRIMRIRERRKETTLKKKILFLMSDTGGGHRAAAEAIRDALLIRYGEENIDAKLVDVFKASHFPMNYMPEFYPWLVNHSKGSWGFGYNLSNTKRRAAVLSRGMYIANARRFRRMLDEFPADVVVSVHSVITRPTLRAFRSLEKRPPYITVVTDLVSTHMFWFDRRAEITLVPTEEALENGLSCGLDEEKLRVTGLPVHPGFTEALIGQENAREQLGWDAHKPTILMVAGGDGMGTLFETAKAINERNLDCQIAIIAGRNKALKTKLEAYDWHQPTHIYGFVTNMPVLMEGADVLVTKAGPATISEAAIAGVPMILNDAIPGQEDGNVTHVIQHGAGAYAPNPQEVAETVEAWLAEGKAGLQERAEKARAIARPDAVWDIADEVWQWAHSGLIEKQHNTKRRTKRLWEITRQIVPL
jgi:1,2-diacylglycerol 3-beta-galactosyltransferase